MYRTQSFKLPSNAHAADVRLDFARLLSVFEKRGVSFVSVTQEFHTSTSMGRLTLNILLSFAQFEREIIGERTRDKNVGSAQKRQMDGRHSGAGL
jgi:site-specific DNA recombinase